MALTFTVYVLIGSWTRLSRTSVDRFLTFIKFQTINGEIISKTYVYIAGLFIIYILIGSKAVNIKDILYNYFIIICKTIFYASS